MKYLDKVDEGCSVIGATNTVIFSDGILKGYNTPYGWVFRSYKEKNIPIKNSKVLLLGAGGAARAIVAAFAKENAEEIVIANRTIEKANELIEFGKKLVSMQKQYDLKDAENML